MPIATTNSAMLSAKYAVFSALWKAVEEIQMSRAGFSVGCPVFGSTAAAASSLVGLPGVVEEASHLRVRLAVRRCQRVLADRGGELLGLGPGIDLLAGDGRVGRADDLLAGELGANRVTTTDADDRGADAQRDQDDAGGDAAQTCEIAHTVDPLKEADAAVLLSIAARPGEFIGTAP